MGTILPVSSHLYPPPPAGRASLPPWGVPLGHHPWQAGSPLCLGLILWSSPPRASPASEVGQLLGSDPVSSVRRPGSGPGRETRKEEALIWVWPTAAPRRRASRPAQLCEPQAAPLLAVNATLSVGLALLLGHPHQPQAHSWCPLHPTTICEGHSFPCIPSCSKLVKSFGGSPGTHPNGRH